MFYRHHWHSRHLPIFHKSRRIASRIPNCSIHSNELQNTWNDFKQEFSAFYRPSPSIDDEKQIFSDLNSLIDLGPNVYSKKLTLLIIFVCFPTDRASTDNSSIFLAYPRLILGFNSILKTGKARFVVNRFQLYLATGRCFLISGVTACLIR